MERIRLYIDKENIKSMVQSKDLYLLKECGRLISKNIDVYYNFPMDKAAKEEYKKDKDLSYWFGLVAGQGVENKSEYSATEEDVLPVRPLSSNDFRPDGKGDCSGIYLLRDTEDCEKLRLRNCVLIGGIGNELEVFKRLLKLNDSGEVFLSEIEWDKYCPRMPLTDIVLCDPYYFSNPEAYKENNNKLLRVLSHMPRNFPVNVVIITRIRKASESEDIRVLDQELENIRELVRQMSGNQQSAVTIVGVRNGIHDRELITNYYRISSTMGFQKMRVISKDVRCAIRSHANCNNYNVSLTLMEDAYQGIIKRALYCKGDKVSNFFEF